MTEQESNNEELIEENEPIEYDSCFCGENVAIAFTKGKSLTLELSQLRVTLSEFEAEEFTMWLLCSLKPKRYKEI